MNDLTYEYPAEVVMQRARETRAMIEENERLRSIVSSLRTTADEIERLGGDAMGLGVLREILATAPSPRRGAMSGE